MPSTISRALVTGALLIAAAVPAAAQSQARPPREPRGFDFSPNGVWRRRARQVQAARAAALARGDLSTLNRPASAFRLGPNACGQGPLVICGVQYDPVILVQFANTPAGTVRAPSEYFDALLAPTPVGGRPYTLRTYYEEISNGLFSVQGQIIGWTTLSDADTWYEGTCNGLCGNGNGKMDQLIREAVQKNDTTVNFGQFDNDGPDGVPNSGDDDGVVDLLVLIHPEGDGACGTAISNPNRNLWSHRFFYSGWPGTTGPLVTNDARAGGGNILVNDYTIQAGVGGSTGCNVNAIMPVGTVAHESGHGFNLPDLYDTQPNDADDAEGIGEWGLMSSGNYRTPLSPAYMEGWSRLQLGWVTVRDLVAPGTYTLGAYNVGDTIFRVQPIVPNSRGEYWLIENRQRTLSDTALIRSKGAGLLVFHVDSAQLVNGGFNNTVNSGSVHGLSVEQADGLRNLDVNFGSGTSNRGDAGDPFPGSTNNAVFGLSGNPSPAMHGATGLAGFVLDSIRQVVAQGEMAFRLRFGYTVQQTFSGAGNVTATPGSFSSPYLLLPNDSVVLTASATGAAAFVGWSGDTSTTNATLKLRGTRDWAVVANFAPPLAVADTALAAGVMGTPYGDAITMTGGNGTFTYSLVVPGSLPLGLDLAPNGAITGTPAKDSTYNFVVRATSGPQTKDLPLRIVITAPTLTLSKVTSQLLDNATVLTANELSYLDLLGNHNGFLDVGDFLAWLDKTGQTLTPSLMQQIMSRGRR